MMRLNWIGNPLLLNLKAHIYILSCHPICGHCDSTWGKILIRFSIQITCRKKLIPCTMENTIFYQDLILKGLGWIHVSLECNFWIYWYKSTFRNHFCFISNRIHPLLVCQLQFQNIMKKISFEFTIRVTNFFPRNSVTLFSIFLTVEKPPRKISCNFSPIIWLWIKWKSNPYLKLGLLLLGGKWVQFYHERPPLL